MYVVRRSEGNPLIEPRSDHAWEARGTFNPTVVKKGAITHLFYRAQGQPDALMSPAGLSTIGKALSLDGDRFQNRRQFIVPEHDWERYGCEDPRVTFFEGKYYVFYTALGGQPFGPGNIKVGVAILSPDLETIEEKHLVTPFNAKAMSLFPERVNGKVTAILTAHTDEPPAHMAVVQCDSIEELWSPAFWEQWHKDLPSYILDPRRLEQDHIESGAPPIKTKDGWLVVYSYIQNYFGGGPRVFGIEALLLALEDPHTIAGRTKGAFMVPEETYERYGLVPDIVFPTGAILQKSGKLDIYYGAADTACAKASVYLPDLIEAMLPQGEAEIAVRAKENPILAPVPEHDWEKRAVFNPAVLDIDGTVHILYRAMSGDNTSTFGHAESKNGIKITERMEKPAYMPRAEFEMKKGPQDGNSGCEDPRLTRIDDTIYLGYTAFDGVNPPRAAVSSIGVKDFVAHKFDKWAKPQLATPDMVDDKDAFIFPEKIDGQFMFVHRIGGLICADFLDSLDFSKHRINRCIDMFGPRKGMWDGEKVGAAGPPIKTPEGWLFIYHAVSRTKTYRLGAALLDLKNPAVVLSRTTGPIFEPVEKWEKEGEVPKVVFSCGMVARKDTLFLYYGGADKVIGVAKLSIKKLLKILNPPQLATK